MIYTKNGKTITLNESIAKKVIEVVGCGLVKGVGKPEPGKMCVEAAVNYACGFEHGDDPICVGEAVRAFKIRLNDSPRWRSGASRAEGMKYIAVAQLGSDTLDQVEFAKRLAFKHITQLLADLLDQRGIKHECREAKTLDEAVIAAREARSAALAAADAAAAYAAYAAAAAAADAAAAAAAADAAADEKFLVQSANICLGVLKEMNSPGCQWLSLIEDKTPA